MANTAKPRMSMEELRKLHAKAFMRWTEDEDKTLLEEYKRFNQDPDLNFEYFLERVAAQFGRKPNGIRGRPAKYFPDIAGWDYEGQEKRDEERKNKKEKNESVKAPALKKEKPLAVPAPDFSGNPEAREALRVLNETSNSLFLTGEAGTGKSTLLQYFRSATQKNVVVLAPTGVAALNVEGQTIHSFCAFGPDITLQKVKKLKPGSGKFQLLQKLDMVIIDEISMVRADLLDCVDKFLRLNGPSGREPFGGVQMDFIGDLYQLPPVDKGFGSEGGLFSEYASPYFFDSHSFRQTRFLYIQLKKIYRQKDSAFIEVLNAVR